MNTFDSLEDVMIDEIILQKFSTYLQEQLAITLNLVRHTNYEYIILMMMIMSR